MASRARQIPWPTCSVRLLVSSTVGKSCSTKGLLGWAACSRASARARRRTPDCKMAAGYPMKLGSSGPAVTGAIGGGLWFVSSHSKNLKRVRQQSFGLDTNLASQKLSPGFPAYGPDDAPWVATQDASGSYAAPLSGQPTPQGVLVGKAANEIWSGWSARCRTLTTRFGRRTSYRRSLPEGRRRLRRNIRNGRIEPRTF